MNTQGFLAVWCEMKPEDLTDYHNWLTQEHISDRIYSPGFLGVRLFTAVDNECLHFFLYATDGPEVLGAAPYLKILNTPSPWTQRLMVRFGPFDRAAGERLVKIGRGFGSHVLVSRIHADNHPVDAASLRDSLRSFIRLPDTVALRLFKTDRQTTAIKSNEKKMRVGGEGEFDYLLVIESLNEAGAREAGLTLSATLQSALPGFQSCDSLIGKMIYGEMPYEYEAP